MADIELVIKIPSNYDLSKIQNGSIASKIILNAVANGTPLPKGHGRLIDADALAYELKHFGEICLDEAMTIIEADKESEG